MASFDIFRGDAFSAVSLAAAIEKVPFQPQYLSSLGIFMDMPVNTKNVWVESRSGVLNLIQSTRRGDPLPERTTEKRDARSFNTVRIAKRDRLMADEIQSIRAFGNETELMSAQAEVARRLSGPAGLQREVEMTWENHRLGAIQGKVLDADGTTVINDWFSASTGFNITQPTEVAFDLTGANAAGTTTGAPGKLRPFIQKNITRPMVRAAKGAFGNNAQIYALCGDNFYDDLTNHGDVRQTYLNWNAAADLRPGNAFETFPFGGVTWVNYRGTDDNSAVAINVDKCKFFPVGAPGLFRVAWAPAEFFDFVNTPGKPLYPLITVDQKRNAYMDIEVFSYPLFMCTRPEVLFSGRRGA